MTHYASPDGDDAGGPTPTPPPTPTDAQIDEAYAYLRSLGVRSCDEYPADARWEVGCEPGCCVVDMYHLTEEERPCRSASQRATTTIKDWVARLLRRH